jgi:hypothetical protein
MNIGHSCDQKATCKIAGPNSPESQSRIPPALAERILALSAMPSYRDVLLGDMAEQFGEQVQEFGRKQAVLIYWSEVAKSVPLLLFHHFQVYDLLAWKSRWTTADLMRACVAQWEGIKAVRRIARDAIPQIVEQLSNQLSRL